MRKYAPHAVRDPVKNYFPMPNELFLLGLSYGAIAVYSYLLHIEDRKTFRSYAAYRTIGKAVRMSENTVHKYVKELEERGLVRTEPTSVVTRSGRKRNGVLQYNICPIGEAVDRFNERQMEQLRVSARQQRCEERLAKMNTEAANA